MLRFLPGVACISLVLAAALSQAASAEEVFGARYPALSPDGGTVVFEYWGDLWSAPVDGSEHARRLTDHLAWDFLPRFSPDGNEIAFCSSRSGNGDVWIIPAQGGAARQVTTFSGTDTLCNWSADGGSIIFSSRRGLWATDLYIVDAQADDPPRQITKGDHYNSTEGLELPQSGWLYSRGNGRWWRKGYRGTSQFDLWRINGDGRHEQLTEHPGNDHWPMLAPGGDTAFYVTDEDGIDNIWSLKLGTGKQKQLTRHSSDGVQWPSIAPGGGAIVYEFDGHIYTVKTSGGTPKKLDLTIAAEGKDNWVTKESFNNDADDYAVSPHGKYVVISHAGDLWAVKDPDAYDDEDKPDQDLARAWRLTASDGSRERMPAFAPDNRHIAYASDADGDYEIFVMDLSDLSTRKVTDNGVDDLLPEFDPSSADVLYYYSGNRELVRHDLNSDEASLVAEGRFRGAFSHRGYSVSPDGQWVAYVDELDDWSAEIYIVDSMAEMEPVNITRHPDSDGSPRWSKDGRRLIYRGRRNDEPAIFVIDLDPEPETYDLTFLFEEDQPGAKEEEDEEEEEDDEENEEDDDDDDDDNDEDNDDDDEEDGDNDEKDDEEDDDEGNDEDGKVVIDFDDIHLRARKVTTQRSATDAVISDDGEWVVFECNPDGEGREIWAVKAEGGDARKLFDASWSSPTLAAKGKRIYYRDGGTIKYTKYGNGKSKGRETIDAKGDFILDQRVRVRQMLREGWRTLREQFYDAGMHGADWDAVYEKYLPYVESLGTHEEFGLMFQELLGELNASHLGIYMAGRSYSGDGPSTGHLGLEFEEDYEGPGLRVSHITYRGPADQPGVEIEVGDIILSVEDARVHHGVRWESALDDMAGRPVRLEVQDPAADGGSREVLLKATSHGAYQGMLYREWEMDNERLVEELSGGRVGYIHIRSMSRGELAKFEREFFSEFFDNEALIVDVRFNPGGFIHEQLFELLDRNPFGFARQRDAPQVRQPAGAFLKPKALLINARSGSDAEIFPSGWRTLGLGPVIGIDTAGAVIGTTSFTLIDGTRVRLPIEGWFGLEGRNLELSGTPPDIYIDVHPDELSEGHDAQLVKAVELLLAELD